MARMTDLIKSIPTEFFWPLIGILLLVAGVMFFTTFSSRRKVALIKRTPIRKLGFAAPGLVAIEGTIEGIRPEKLRAPLTQSECCWYSSTVEKYDRLEHDRESSPSWSTIDSQRSATACTLSDATGSCVIHLDGAEVIPTDFSLWHGSSPEPTERNPERRAAYEPTGSSISVSNRSTHQYRYREERIYDGNSIFVIGNLVPYTPQEDSDAPVEGDEWEDDIEVVDDPHLENALTRARQRLRDCAIVSALPRNELIQKLDMGAKGGLYIGIVMLVLASFFVWARFGS